ncbi:hypothetical protein ACQUY5_32190, partial [Bacillus cereus]|uniref:hypothetical protein n=1 Tax=Bacillus cereus TaxID=1396 RepID=UPI003D17767A
VLADSFEGITIHQISSFITRSCKLETGVLWKEGKLHTLRSTVQIPNNVIELANYIVEDAFKRSGGSSNYIEQTKMNKQILLEAVQKIDNIPAFQIQTIEEYNELCRIRESLVGMIVHK